MIDFIKNLFKCKHKNVKNVKWLSQCNTPMIKSTCKDCGKKLYYGHVYADPNTWLEKEE